MTGRPWKVAPNRPNARYITKNNLADAMSHAMHILKSDEIDTGNEVVIVSPNGEDAYVIRRLEPA